MYPSGEITLRVDCACGHTAELRAEDVGCDPLYFKGWDRLRCSRCGRKGRPAAIMRSWSPAK